MKRVMLSATLMATTIAVTAAGCTGTKSSPAAPTCSFSIAPSNYSAPAAGGATSVSVTTIGGCAWTSSASSVPWAGFLGQSSATGSGSATIQVAPNGTGVSRTTSFVIAGQSFVVTQPAQVVATQTSLTVQVRPDCLGKLSFVQVFVDNGFAGDIPPGGQTSQNVAPGTHAVFGKIVGLSLNGGTFGPFNITVAAGQNQTQGFTCP